MRVRARTTRMSSGVALVALLALLTGCATTSGNGDQHTQDDPASTASSEEGTASQADEFCAATDQLGQSLLATMDQNADPSVAAEAVSTAKQILTEVSAPAAIAEPWEFLTGAMTLFEEAFARTEDGSADLDGEEGFATVLLLPGGVEAVGVYLQQECGVDLGITEPVIADVCAAVDAASLGSVFDTVPAGVPQRWGGATVECRWEADERSVGAMVGSVTTVADEILQGAEPVEQVQMDGYTIDAYTGSLGVFRFDTRGNTAAAVVGDWAVMVSVDSGDDAADKNKAIALAGMLADALP